MLRKMYAFPSGFSLPLLLWGVYAIAASSLSVILIAMIGALLGTETIMSWDNRIQQFVYLHSESRLRLLPTISLISSLGSFKITTVIAIMFSLLFFGKRTARFLIYGYAVLGSFAMMWILNTGLKSIFRKDRPELEHLSTVTGFSFPSGHAMIAMGFYGILFTIWAIERQRQSKSILLPMACGMTVIALLGLSRIMLGVHFPTDIMAGYAAGLAWILCMTQGIKRSLP